MTQVPFQSMLPDFQKPLRDAFRGAACIADVTEEALEPASRLLPSPLRTGLQGAAKALEGASRRFAVAPVDPEHIHLASEFIAGKGGAPDACASVICFAWELLNGGGRHLMVSETILSRRLARRPAPRNDAPALNAVSLIRFIRDSSAIGRMPGVAGGLSPREMSEIDVILVAVAVWLLSARADDKVDEEILLDLSFALVSSLRDDLEGISEDRDGLAEFVERAAAHL